MYKRPRSPIRQRQQARAALNRPDLSMFRDDPPEAIPSSAPLPTIEIIRTTPPSFGSCRACYRSIEWVRTLAGRLMPVDRPLLPIRLHERQDGTMLTVIESRQSHFATCPAADRFRKKKR